jgi:hypothetical protein
MTILGNGLRAGHCAATQASGARMLKCEGPGASVTQRGMARSPTAELENACSYVRADMHSLTIMREHFKNDEGR